MLFRSNGSGVVLMQEGRTIDFESRPIKGKYLQKDIYEKEILEIDRKSVV